MWLQVEKLRSEVDDDVPMEKIVSELLGHSSISITENSYGKVVQKKVSDEMKRLRGSNDCIPK